MTLHRVLAAFVVVGLVLALPARAATLAGVTLPDKIEIAGHPLVLNGMGIRKATFLKVKVYVAGLYLEARSHDANKILRSAQRKHLVLHFVRDVDRSDIVKAWQEGFEKNVKDVRPLAPRIRQLAGYMTDMKEGRSLAFTLSPQGVVVTVGSVVKGTIPGEDFARAFLSIWLGPDPPNEDLKQGLLGR